MNPEPVIGAIDIGGSKIAAGVVDNSGSILARAETPSDPLRGYPAAMARTTELLSRLLNECGRPLAGIGVASTGPIDPETGIYGEVGTLPGWNASPLIPDLQEAFGVRAAVENDADAAALAEAAWGAGRGKNTLLYVTVSTGIGVGIVLNGRLYRGAGGAHPELGHHVIDASNQGPVCYCTAHGCWESLASGPALESWARANGGQSDLTAQRICELAREGDALMARAVERAACYLGLGLANLVTMYCPDTIALGGGMMKSADLLLPGVLAVVKQICTQVPAANTSIVLAELGSDTGLLGGACVWLHRSGALTQ